MSNSAIAIIILIYSAWAIYSRFKVLTGRSAWLDTKISFMEVNGDL